MKDSEAKDKAVYQKKKLPQKDKEGNRIILPVLPPKRTADDPKKPLYVKRNWAKYEALWKKINSKKCK